MILNFLRLGTLLPIRYILYESNSRKSATFATAKFSFLKNHRDHKNEKKIEFANTFILFQGTIAKNKIGNSVWCNIFFGPKMDFVHDESKNNFFSFPSDFAF